MYSKTLVGVLLAGALTLPLVLPFTSRAAVRDWERSMSIVPQSTTDFGSQNYKDTIDYLKSLGFNSVTLIIPLYQADRESTKIVNAWNTPTGSALVAATQYAHEKGLRVTYKIHLDPGGSSSWRASINPPNRDEWFFNYTWVLAKYAAIAQRNGVEAFCLGAELISMTRSDTYPSNTDNWRKLIADIRTLYKGKVFYDANWSGPHARGEAALIGFWGELDYLGISAYYPFPGDGSIASIETAWDQVRREKVQPLYEQFKKPILFSEVGYRSLEGAHEKPWEWQGSGTYDPSEQVNAYTALIQYWDKHSYMQGIGLWQTVADPNAGGSGNTDFFIRNKPVEEVFRRFFGGTPVTASVTAMGLVSPNQVSANTSITLNAYVTPKGASIPAANVDLEVYNASGTQVHQYVFSNRDLAAEVTRRLGTNWTPTTPGTYTLKIGVFSSDWSKLYVWNNDAAKLQVN